MVLTHHTGAHGPPLCRGKPARLPQRGPPADLYRASALGAQDAIPVLIDRPALLLGIALREDETVPFLPPSIVVQLLVPQQEHSTRTIFRFRGLAYSSRITSSPQSSTHSCS